MVNKLLIFALILGTSSFGFCQAPLQFANLSAQDQRDIIDLQERGSIEDWRAQPIYKEVFDTCKNNSQFKKFAANAAQSMMSSTQLLSSSYLTQLYGTRFLSFDIYSAIHSGGFYQAIKDCSGDNIYARDAMLFTFVGGDIFGRVVFVAFAVSLFRFVKYLGLLDWAGKLLEDFPILQKAALAGGGIYAIHKGFEIYDILSPEKRAARSAALKAQEIDIDPEHVVTRQLIKRRIDSIEEKMGVEKMHLAVLAPDTPEYENIKEKIHRHRIDVLNMRLALNFAEAEDDRSLK